MSSANIYAQFLLTEDFSEYADGSSVQNATEPANPDAGEWVTVNESSGSTDFIVVNEQLSYPGYIYSAKGKTLLFSPVATDVGNAVLCLSRMHLPYPCQPEGGFIDGSNEFYTAFMLNIGETNTSDSQEIFSYYQLSSGVRRGSLFYKLSSDKNSVAFSFQKKLESPSSSWTKYYNKTQTFLFVIKYSHVCLNEKNLGHSEFQLFINPDADKTEEENSSSMINAYGNETGYDTDLRYINFRQSGKTTMKTAGIRVANSFEKVLLGPDNMSGIVHIPKSEPNFYVDGKTLFPINNLNGNLRIYDVSSCLLRAYETHDGKPIKTDLEPGVYILLYQENGDEFIQKILIR